MAPSPGAPRPEDRLTAATSEADAATGRESVQPGSTDGDEVAAGDPGQIAEFRLLRRLGSGGMAEVWLAEQTSLHRHVALKLLRRELTVDPTYVRRFESEAKAAAGLNHPNIVQVYAVGEHEGQHYIVQEYVQGQTLKTLLLRKGPLSAQVALHVMRQVAAALIAAAERGIVHRDIKPENIMLTRKGDVKVADFGLAQITHGEQLHLTQEGVTMGTPLYMSPEQVKGKKLDQRSDIYSFGVTCYHMLTGRPPFRGESAVAVAVQHVQDDPEPLRLLRPDLPGAVCDLVSRMMAKDPAERYQDAAALQADVRRLLKAYKETGAAQEAALAELSTAGLSRNRAWHARQIGVAAALVVLLAGAGAALGWLQRTPSPLDVPGPASRGVPREPSAQAQYLRAQFSGGAEEEWLAVRQYWPDPKDQDWRIRATEQLALLYLNQPNRAADARRELAELATYELRHKRYAAEARLGEACLAVSERGDYGQANSILNSSASLFEQHLSGSWYTLYERLRDRVRDELGLLPRVPRERLTGNG